MRPPIRTTHTTVLLTLSQEAFDEVAGKLRAAAYDHSFMEDGTIDMFGIAIERESDVAVRPAVQNVTNEEG